MNVIAAVTAVNVAAGPVPGARVTVQYITDDGENGPTSVVLTIAAEDTATQLTLRRALENALANSVRTALSIDVGEVSLGIIFAGGLA